MPTPMRTTSIIVSRRRVISSAVGLIVLCATLSVPIAVSPGALNPQKVSSGSTLSAPGDGGALVKQSCVSCHNGRLKTGGLALDDVDFAAIPASAELWEKVVRKLGTGAMPPPEAPQPDEATRHGLATWLETELDAAAMRRPNPGEPLVHRMNRAEYANAIRDLLDLDVDVAPLLPPDDSAYGFDNISDVLGLSPVLMSVTSRRPKASAHWQSGSRDRSRVRDVSSSGRSVAGSTSREACRSELSEGCTSRTCSRSTANIRLCESCSFGRTPTASSVWIERTSSKSRWTENGCCSKPSAATWAPPEAARRSTRRRCHGSSRNPPSSALARTEVPVRGGPRVVRRVRSEKRADTTRFAAAHPDDRESDRFDRHASYQRR